MDHRWLLVTIASVSLQRRVWCGPGIAVSQSGRHLGRRRGRNIPLNAKVTDAITITQKSIILAYVTPKPPSQKRDSIPLRAGHVLGLCS